MRSNYVLAKICVLQEEREEEGREEREEEGGEERRERGDRQQRQRSEREDRREQSEVCMTKHLHILFRYFILQSHLIG